MLVSIFKLDYNKRLSRSSCHVKISGHDITLWKVLFDEKASCERPSSSQPYHLWIYTIDIFAHTSHTRLKTTQQRLIQSEFIYNFAIWVRNNNIVRVSINEFSLWVFLLFLPKSFPLVSVTINLQKIDLYRPIETHSPLQTRYVVHHFHLKCNLSYHRGK